jgi:hypothetical protein
MKIFSDDPLVPYKTTKIDPITTKHETDGLLARWGIKRVFWDWNIDIGKVTLMFDLPLETFGKRSPAIKLEPPIIWSKAKRHSKEEEINWAVSMRCLFWFLKHFLEVAYVMQFETTVVFMPWILGSDGKTQLKDIILPKLELISSSLALPSEEQFSEQEKRNARKIIDVGS